VSLSNLQGIRQHAAVRNFLSAVGIAFRGGLGLSRRSFELLQRELNAEFRLVPALIADVGDAADACRILHRLSPFHRHDDDRLRLPPASPPRNSKARKKITGPPPQPTLPAIRHAISNSSLGYRRSDARIVDNRFATSGSVNN
jgi:hypothetical protein